MESYIVRTKIDIERQAGDSGRIVFTVPAEVSLTGYDVLFQVRDDSDEILFDYTTEASEITVVGQTITITLDKDDTAELSGIYNWELQIYDVTNVATIGKGRYILISEVAR